MMARTVTTRRRMRSKELAALYEAALAIAGERSLDKLLQKIVDVAQELVDARYAALGVPGPDGSLLHFVTAGMSAQEIAQIGDKPCGKGVLGVLMREPRSLRLPEIAAHPESYGFPPNHPKMSSFLGVPLIHQGHAMGTLYLTDKIGGVEFTGDDEALIEMLAAQAAVAIENARLFARSDQALQRKVDELQAERRNLQAIVDQLPEGVAILDADAETVLLLNRAALALLGLTDGHPGESNSARDLFRSVNQDGALLQYEETALQRAVANGATMVAEQMVLLRADGTSFTALANATRLADPSVTLVGWIVVFQDITTLKELERLKDELISIITHELRNPLTAIRGRAQLMLRSARRTPGREEDVVGLTAVDAQVEKLADMVRELAEVSQMRLGLMKLRPQPTDLVSLARQQIEQIGAADEQHTYRLDTSVASLTGQWDGQRIEQVIFNLLENARKYSPEGASISLSLGLKEDATKRNVSARWAIMAVSDEGIGVPTEAKQHLFDRFYRAANAKGRAETGLGIGLYICHEIVAQHGGEIWLDSAEGKGSTFYFTLPLSD